MHELSNLVTFSSFKMSLVIAPIRERHYLRIAYEDQYANHS